MAVASIAILPRGCRRPRVLADAAGRRDPTPAAHGSHERRAIAISLADTAAIDTRLTCSDTRVTGVSCPWLLRRLRSSGILAARYPLGNTYRSVGGAGRRP